MPAVTVSAPGKAILMGEHAAVYGRPALVAAVDRRLEARLTGTGGTAAAGSGVRLELPAVEVSETVEWHEIRAYARAARDRWLEYRRRPGPETFRRLRGDDPAHLVKVALGEAADFLDDGEPPGVELRLRSEIPIGAGFGSSAAAAAAITLAYLRLRGAEVATEALEGLALDVERRQHGAPSGIDTVTVIRGGLVWATRDAGGRVVARR
jgi:mevalonate kinase